MSITSATLAQPIGTQPIQGQFSAPAMSTTYLPITPDFVSSPSKLSIAQLTDRIDSCVQAYLSPTFLDSLLTSLQPVDHSPHHPVHDVSTPFQDLTIQKLAATYSETCSLIWQQSLTSAPSLALSLTATHPLYFSLQSLTLCWVTGKYHHPDSPFFCDAITLGALQSKWRYPAIQSSLRHTTAAESAHMTSGLLPTPPAGLMRWDVPCINFCSGTTD